MNYCEKNDCVPRPPLPGIAWNGSVIPIMRRYFDDAIVAPICTDPVVPFFDQHSEYGFAAPLSSRLRLLSTSVVVICADDGQYAIDNANQSDPVTFGVR